jgi:6-phosphogluconate dehydrogenase (decarboxylating)
MLPTAAVDPVLHSLVPLLEPGDLVIEGGNSYYHDGIRRAAELKTKGLHHVDVGVSGGVGGLERGYCDMIGGEDAIVQHLDPIFRSLSPGVQAALRTPGASGEPSQAEYDYLHCGPNGAGHFVKMVHNGIEYGMMAAFAEGFDIIKNAESGLSRQDVDAETTPLREPDHYKYKIDVGQVAQMWRRGSRLVRGCSISPPERCARTPSWQISRIASQIRVKGAGPCMRRSTKVCRRLSSVRRSIPASTHVAMPTTPTASCRQCASRSEVTSRSRLRTRL